MASSHEDATSEAALRARAEEQMRAEPADTSSKSPEETLELLHELRVHQIELEMQNEQLKATQGELEQERERYIKLYDFAPVGYLSVSRHGLITEANLTAVSMLGLERSRLLKLPLSQFIHHADQESYYLCWRKVFETGMTQSCELRFRPANGVVFHGRVEAVQGLEDGVEVCHLVLIDISRQKQTEAALRDSERRRLTYENEEWKRLALDAAELGAWDQDLQTGRISCSTHVSTMLGLPDRPFTWEEFSSHIHPDDSEAFKHELTKSLDSHGTGRCEIIFRAVHSNGSVKWLRFVARTFFEAGHPTHAMRGPASLRTSPA